MKKIIILCLISIQFLLAGCAIKSPVKTSKIEKSYYSRIGVDKRTKEDKVIKDFLKPYKQQLENEMGKVIGYSKNDMPTDRSKCETLLGNFVSDVVFETSKKFGTVDCAIINSGGLRASIFKGEIKVSDIFQLMPFENKIVIVKFTGKQLKRIVEEIVHDNGVPLSNITIVASSGVIEAFINGKELDEQKVYHIATIDYVANGGGGLKSMWEGKIIKETNVLLREAIIKYVEDNKTIDKKIEGRVVIQ